jgi:hypothetical protein
MQERVCYPCFPSTGATMSGASGGSRVRLTNGLCAPRLLDLILTKDGNYCSAHGPSFHPAWRRHATCSANYSWWRWLGKMIDYNRRYFTEPLLIASVAVAFLALREAWRRRPLAPRVRLLILLGVAGLLPVILFPSSARYHHYWQFYLLPYAVLSLAQILDVVGPHLTFRGRRFLHIGIVLWLVVASTATLWYRYTHPRLLPSTPLPLQPIEIIRM